MCHPRVGFECSRPCHLSALLCFALPHQKFLDELHVKHCIACLSAIRQQIVFTFVNICVSRNAPPPPFVPGAKLVQDLITPTFFLAHCSGTLCQKSFQAKEAAGTILHTLSSLAQNFPSCCLFERNGI